VTASLVIQPLNSGHDRQAFECGVPPLDRYLRELATQDIKRRLGNCFVATEGDSPAVVAYYTLAASSVPLSALPESATKRLPHYPLLPATLIGRLAVARPSHGKGIASLLVIDALHRSARSEPMSFTLLVDAKDDGSVAFYRKLGFIALASRPRTLFLPIATALKLFG
jgi:ribosomal protein S18 acetylase RimI-like enzyme